MAIVFGDWLPVPEAQCRQPNELIAAVGKWMPVRESLHQLKRVYGGRAKTRAKAGLLKPMRSGVLLTAIQCVRLRDGRVASHVVWQYPVPSYWDSMSPEALGEGLWQIPKGEDGHTIIRCAGYVDFQSFNALFFTQHADKDHDESTPLQKAIREFVEEHPWPDGKVPNIYRVRRAMDGSELWKRIAEKHGVSPNPPDWKTIKVALTK